MKHLFLARMGCGFALLLTQTIAANAQDTVSFSALSPQMNASSSPIWVQCVNEGSDCKPGTSSLVTTRYGTEGTYYFYVTENVEKIPCKNSVNGDPKQGSDKSCQYTVENVLGAPDSTASWNKAATEGESFTYAPTGDHWVRYGTKGHYVYAIIQGGNIQSMPCSNSYFGIDPIKENKSCDVGPEYTQGSEGFTECAKEGQSCQPNAATTLLIRYGTKDGWDTRFYRSGDGSFPCSNTFFGYDPIHKDKSCLFEEITPTSVITEGEWKQVGSCSGNACDNLSKSITYGTSKTSQWSTTSEWGVTVTESMEAGFGIKGVGVKVTASVAASFSQSLGFQEALTTSQSETLSATCDLSGSTTGLMYQFLTGTVSSCVESGHCTGDTLTADYACIANPPNNYPGPQCVPGYCSDELCLQCSY
ncbi:hypothetical protein NBRC116594_12680 [Shimia sp. NS0008-38b]|uniref:hypothetical protein n=1 Tax=Shimia sp. NS0008-38b TaxID=3127653 RepID=UPI00310B502A